MPFALITGASKGIGKAIARNLAARGYDLLLVARSEDLLKETASEIAAGSRVDCQWLALDLSKDGSAAEVYAFCKQRALPVSILVNNAGYGLSGPFEKYTAETHVEMLHLNILTLVSLTRLFLPDLKKQSDAYILNIGSSAAYQAIPFLSVYAASKSFVLNFSRGLQGELKGSRVSVTCVCPGPTDTNFVNRANVGEKGQKAAARFNMSPEAVAHIAVDSLFKRKSEVITGGMNKLSAFFAWLLPKSLVEGVARKLYD
jgi:short-subunit dehydrogenase